MVAYSDGYAMRVEWSFPRTATLNDGRGFCIFNVKVGGTCFYMEVIGETADTLNTYTSFWQEISAIKTIKANTNQSMGTKILSSLPAGWGGQWDTDPVRRVDNATDRVIRNRFLPKEADSYTQDYRFARAQPTLVALFDDTNGGSWVWEDVTIQGAVAGLSAGAALAVGALALSF